MNDRVELWRTQDEQGVRVLRGHLTPDGALLLEGQDLGPGVEKFWGPGCTEYEYTFTIAAEHIPALREALGLDVDLFAALRIHFRSLLRTGPQALLNEFGIPYSFWSRIGD